jgi:serine/threonine protein kinase
MSIAGYDPLSEIGRDGERVVYKARHTASGRTVALEMFTVARSAVGLARVRRQIELETSLDHPQIWPILDIREHDGVPFAVRPFVDAVPLAQRTGRAFPPEQAARYVEQIARAVQHAHGRGVLHRDVSPENILLTHDGVPLLTGFDCARWAPGVTCRPEPDAGTPEPGAVVGTPSYMAPEQAKGSGASTACDVYGLGAVLYELLTGRPPFRGATVLETLQQVLNDRPRPPRKLNPALPADLERICLKCLEKAPADRYPSARALADDLRRFLDDEPVAARPPSLLRRLRAWATRLPG